MSEVYAIEVAREVEAVPVAGPEAIKRGGLIRSVAPATQAMAVAASGFLAGAALVGWATRRRAHVVRPSRRRGSPRKAAREGVQTVQILGTRSLLVDVHLLGAAKR